MNNRIAIRVEGSSKIGTGHVARSLTLAQEFSRRGVESVFCLKDVDGLLSDEISRKGFQVSRIPVSASFKEDAKCFTLTFEKYHCQGAVLDGYDFNQNYLESVRASIPFILSIDDLAETVFCSDMVLNQNINATAKIYEGKVSSRIKLLLGPAYALLREEFNKLHAVPKDFSRVKNILVTFGGADPHNVTLKAIRALERLCGDFRITVVVGVSNPHEQEIKNYTALSKSQIHVLKNVDHMGELMVDADMAISSGGSTSWELCCLGVPTLQIMLAENQRNVITGLDERGVTINLGWHEDVTEEMIHQGAANLMADGDKRRAMSSRGKSLVDGRGAERVVSQALAYCQEKSLL